MSQWLKSLTGCLCILTVLMHLVPNGKFSRYVRFYAGLLFFLVAARPIWNFLAGEGELERLLQLSLLRDSRYDLESSAAGMAELKNDRILEAYRGEIERQIGEIALAYGLAASDIQTAYDEEDAYRMTGVSFAVRPAAWGMASGGGWEPQQPDEASQQPGKALQRPDEALQQSSQAQQPDKALQQPDQAAQQSDQPSQAAAIEDVRKEIASVYALNLSQIHVRRGDT